ncbi:hypothetical protein [Ciceribacter sp. L1K22]|uniref:hypothetical protein n=1 Tax=Ciceribacter sp. L1K22 TaxID=2820275 RepID=UPI001ABE884D|nr:hypothetical protein [Ciceribacter sp. L1K22]MBO3760475.1 hypothetical protein [Ciceribacter sp. L1K22]
MQSQLTPQQQQHYQYRLRIAETWRMPAACGYADCRRHGHCFWRRRGTALPHCLSLMDPAAQQRVEEILAEVNVLFDAMRQHTTYVVDRADGPRRALQLQALAVAARFYGHGAPDDANRTARDWRNLCRSYVKDPRRAPQSRGKLVTPGETRR